MPKYGQKLGAWMGTRVPFLGKNFLSSGGVEGSRTNGVFQLVQASARSSN